MKDIAVKWIYKNSEYVRLAAIWTVVIDFMFIALSMLFGGVIGIIVFIPRIIIASILLFVPSVFVVKFIKENV
jgi:hypothetical protein